MQKKNYLLLISLFAISGLQAQQTNSANSLYVYLDCRDCSDFFIRSEIDFINFVRDQADADVHLIITSQRNGTGGDNYILEYIGLDELKEISNQVEFTTYQSDTNDEQRDALVKYVKLGLVPFLTSKGLLSDFDLNFTGEVEDIGTDEKNDKWNNWVFEVSGSGFYSGEDSEKNRTLNGRLNISRTTDDIKIRLSFRENASRRTIIRKDSTGASIESNYDNNRSNAFGLIAWSLSDHWSIGSYFSGGASTRENIDLRFGITPAIEYSFYPYREFAYHEVTLRYGILTSYYDYTEKTIFGETEEFLARQELNFSMDYIEPWGAISSRISARSYLHDFSKNGLLFNFEVDMRLFRGFSVFLGGFYEIINDQLSLSADGATDAEVLANTQQQATTYQFGGNIGFEITFGSIYDNVVNTRF